MRRFNVLVNNIPEETDEYVVARLVDNELWYFADFDAEEEANICVSELDNAIMLICE